MSATGRRRVRGVSSEAGWVFLREAEVLAGAISFACAWATLRPIMNNLRAGSCGRAAVAVSLGGSQGVARSRRSGGGEGGDVSGWSGL